MESLQRQTNTAETEFWGIVLFLLFTKRENFWPVQIESFCRRQINVIKKKKIV